MQSNLLNIDNLNQQQGFSLEIDGIQPENQVPQRSLTPMQTGLLFGTTRVIGDSLAMNVCEKYDSVQASLLRTCVMHFLGKGTLYNVSKPQISESNNLTTANIKAFACENVGAICGFMAKYGANYLTDYQDKMTETQSKLVSDFILLSTWFATGKLFVNNCNKAITESEIIKKIEESGFSKFKNVKKSSVFFFIDVLASTLAATASIYASPMQNNPQNIIDTTINAMACGTTFAVVQQTTRALLQKAYNTITCERGNSRI
jgi:hypothetical protein